jgi:hypothetical protein
MQLEELIYTALTSASPLTSAGTRVYALIAKQGAPLPRITFQRVSNAPITDLGGSSNLDQVRIQVDSWADDYLEAKTLASQVRAIMEDQTFKALLVSDFDEYEPETRIYRVRQDYRCWFRPVA